MKGHRVLLSYQPEQECRRRRRRNRFILRIPHTQHGERAPLTGGARRGHGWVTLVL